MLQIVCHTHLPLNHTYTVETPEQDLISEIAEINHFRSALPLADFKAASKIATYYRPRSGPHLAHVE